MRIKAATFVLAGGLLALSASAAVVREGNNNELVPNGKGWGEHTAQASGHAKPSSTGISYHGGPVMTGTPAIYYIYYGTWGGTTATIVSDFAKGLGGSPYEAINGTYYNGSNVHVSGNVTLAKTTTDNYSQGTSVSDAGIQAIVASAISSGSLPNDANGVYLVLTSADVNESSGFCTQYCGWHTHATISGTDIKYGFIGNPDRCPSACEGIPNNAPNGNTGADGMVSIIAHEQEEAISDPDLNAWYDSRGRENADKCAYIYGTTYTTANGATANVHLGSRDFLIQQNWKNAGSGGCVTAYP